MRIAARRQHRHYRSSSHIGQRRCRAFPIQEDYNLPTVPRSIDRNPPRAKLVRKAEDWPWSSAEKPRAGLPQLAAGLVLQLA